MPSKDFQKKLQLLVLLTLLSGSRELFHRVFEFCDSLFELKFRCALLVHPLLQGFADHLLFFVLYVPFNIICHLFVRLQLRDLLLKVDDTRHDLAVLDFPHLCSIREEMFHDRLPQALQLLLHSVMLLDNFLSGWLIYFRLLALLDLLQLSGQLLNLCLSRREIVREKKNS